MLRIHRLPVAARSLLSLTLLCVMATGCVDVGAIPSGADTGLSGVVTYRQRIALAPDATVHVRLIDTDSGRVIAQRTIPARGRQVPIPFHLRYASDDVVPGHKHVLRATIEDGSGQLRWVGDTSLSDLSDIMTDIRIPMVQVSTSHRTRGGSCMSPMGPCVATESA